MGKIGVHEFYALDGVFDNPTWTADFGFDPMMGETIGLSRARPVRSCSAVRPSRCSRRPGDPHRRGRSGRVVLQRHAEICRQLDPAGRRVDLAYSTVRPVQRRRYPRPEGEGVRQYYISGSGTLVRALLADGLVDGLHLFVYPVVVGGDKKTLFPSEGPTTKLTLNDWTSTPMGSCTSTTGPRKVRLSASLRRDTRDHGRRFRTGIGPMTATLRCEVFPSDLGQC